jgi:OmpA-OmpF porin, OOP family
MKARSFQKIVLVIGISLFCISATKGQVSNAGYFNQGNRLFDKKDYYAAAQYYVKYLAIAKEPARVAEPFAIQKKVRGGSGTNNTRWQAVYRLAECYRLCHDYTRAEQWYKEAASYPATAFPLAQYWYGVSLRANGKYEAAMLAIAMFQENYTKMDAYLNGADREIKNLRFILAELKRNDKDSFVIRQKEINGLGSAYAASGLHVDTIVFTGISPDRGSGHSGDTSYNNRLYQALSVEDQVTAAGPLKIHPQPAMEDGMATFSEDGKRMFFTRWDSKTGKKNAAIYGAEMTDTGWTEPVKLVSDVNRSGYNSAQPFITESVEGKYLLFSSDRPGGLGNYDLWYAAMDSAYQVLYVKNMGETINSPGDEQSPFFHKNSRTLVFSSNGRPGMGGFDIYYAKGNLSLSEWERPINPGMAINSSKDDLYFMSTDEVNLWNTGWLSSDRASDCCLSLFSFRESNTQYVAGRIVDCRDRKPLEGVSITLTEGRHPKKLLREINSDEHGDYHVELHNTSTFKILAEKKGYIPASGEYMLQFKTGNDSLMNEDICLSLEPDTNLIKEAGNVVQSLNNSQQFGGFAYKKSVFSPSSYPRLDSLVALMNKYPSITIRIDGYTDGIGSESYNLRLAQARVDASINYLVKKGISRDRLQGRAMGKCCPLTPETVNGKDDPAARGKNRRVEYTILTI